MIIGIGEFIKENTNPKIFNGDWETLRKEVEYNFLNKIGITKGYRDGVLLIDVDPICFSCPVIKLKEGDRFRGVFKARFTGEEPRKKLLIGGKELPRAKKVNIIIYRKDVLEESGDSATGADWDMIAVQALDSEDSAPMDPQTLMYNHFRMSGGTSTKMTAEEFEDALRKSAEYWKDRILLGT